MGWGVCGGVGGVCVCVCVWGGGGGGGGGGHITDDASLDDSLMLVWTRWTATCRWLEKPWCSSDVIAHATSLYVINSLTPGKFVWYFWYLIFQTISVIDGLGISCELALIWMPLDLTDEKSPLVQVMAWCRQAKSHYLNQWWPRSLSPYGVTKPLVIWM